MQCRSSPSVYPLTMQRQPTTVPASLIGFFLGSRIILLVVCVRMFGWDARTATALTLALNYLCIPVALAQPGDTRGLLSCLWQPPARWALAFIVLSGASLLWTVADSPASACAFWLAMACDAIFVLLLLHKGPAEQQAFSLMRGFVYGACIVGVIAWILPSQSDLRLGDEELLGPNQIGFVCATALFFAQHQLRRGNKALRPAFAFLMLTLLRSLSKTTIVAFFIAEAVLLICDRSLSRRTRIYLSLAAILVLTIFMRLFFAYADVYLSLGNQSLTLSGRLSIWAYILDEALNSPWIGHGFHSVWKVIPPMNGDFEVRHAHNELLQQFYAYGVIGVALILAYYASFLRAVRRTAKGSQRTFLLSLLLFVLVRGITDTEAFDLSLPCWAMLLWATLLQEPSPEPAAIAVTPVSTPPPPGLPMSSDCHF